MPSFDIVSKIDTTADIQMLIDEAVKPVKTNVKLSIIENKGLIF